MQLGGYCEICARWVWVNGRRECQFGHPASAVREVQPLKPRNENGRPSPAPDATPGTLVVPSAPGILAPPSLTPDDEKTGPSGTARPIPGTGSAATRPYPGPFPPRPRGDRRWWWRHSIWIVLTFTVGFFNWLAFLYIGVRARRVAWLLASLGYLIPITLTVAAIGSSYLGVAIGFQLLMSGVSVMHAFIARPRYRAIMFGDPPAGIGPAPPPLLPRASRPALPRGLDEDVAVVIREAQTQVDEIAAAAESIEKPQIRHKIALLCRTAEDILAELRKDPGQVSLARPFLSYYLEAAHRIVRGYADLAHRGLDTEDALSTMARAEASLASIQRAFDGQLAALLQHQVLDLDSEIALLEKTVQMDSIMTAPVAEAGPTAKTGGGR